MEKQTVKKIISISIIFIFVMFFIQTISPYQTYGAALNWENPNKNGNNPYKFKPQDVLNSQTIMQVVGCTGIVDKVSGAIMGLVKKGTQAVMELLQQKAIIKACLAAKGGAQTAAGGVPNLTITTALGTVVNCDEINNTNDEGIKSQLANDAIKADAEKKRTECFNGIAYTLAKNQLTAMTRYTMSWINTGFSGDPMYVQNINSFVDNLEKSVLETNLAGLMSPQNAYPYGDGFYRSAINGYNYGGSLRSSSSNFLESLQSDLGSFVTDPNSYSSTLEKAKGAVNQFANDFSTGGWDGWLALTQRDQDNPLGSAMQMSQYLVEEQAKQVQDTKDELLTNGGFLSQKRCIEYEKPLSDSNQQVLNLTNGIFNTNSFDAVANNVNVTGAGTTSTNNGGYSAPKKCIKYEVVTPGSIIKDKVSTYINSPERQLELADDINSVLNSVFSMLITQFQNQGLESLSPGAYEYTGVGSKDMNVGVGDNSYSTTGNGFSLSSGYENGSFDLTRDLGNTFIYNYNKKPLGSWNAATNTPKLTKGIGPVEIDTNDNVIYLANVFYIVTTPGKTQLFDDGYAGWAVGDKAFWNGSSWQNWKNGTANPIKERGVIQTQKDYIVAAKELLTNLPNIMSKIGELDYCIPGPNSNWLANSGDTYSNFSDYSYSLVSDYKAGNLLTRDSTTFTIAQPGDKEYENYKTMFDGTPTLWGAIKQTFTWTTLNLYGVGKEIKANAQETTFQENVDNFLTTLSNNLEKFNTDYSKIIEGRYGSKGLMQAAYLTEENTSELKENTAYLPMAETGLNTTKDIITYASDIEETTQSYKDSIIQADSNVYKLDEIKNEVSKIIVAAQARRDQNYLKILNEEAVRSGKPVLTLGWYKDKYKACLDEENISFYEDTDIIDNTGENKERCFDGLDNDLDGLVDAEDPDCAGYITTPQ